MKKSISEEKKENKLAGVLMIVAEQFGKIAANSACCYIYHQPKIPDAVKKLRKI